MELQRHVGLVIFTKTHFSDKMTQQEGCVYVCVRYAHVCQRVKMSICMEDGVYVECMIVYMEDCRSSDVCVCICVVHAQKCVCFSVCVYLGIHVCA